MGFADLLLKMEIAYGSQESIDFAEDLMSFFYEVAKETSERLGKEKGIPLNCKHKEINRRNITLLSIAPTGTLSLLAGCSQGIEPIYSPSTIISNNTGKYESLSSYTDKPWFKCAVDGGEGVKEVLPEEHIRIQAIFQKYCDSGVSKTVNLPNSATVEDIKKIYLLAWKLGVKGVTVYRDKSREFQVLQSKKSSKNIKERIDLLYKVQESKETERREGILKGETYKIHTGSGTLYVTINNSSNLIPYELFCSIGKGGSDIYAFTEAIGRLISLSLQHGVPVYKITKQLIGISGSVSIFHSIGKYRQILSVPDAIGKVLDIYYNSKLLNNEEKENVKIKKVEVNKIDKKESIICPNCNQEITWVGDCKVCGCKKACD